MNLKLNTRRQEDMKKQQRLLRKHYHRRMQKARKQIKELEQGIRPVTKLNRRARKLLSKRTKAGYKLPATLFSKQFDQ